MTDWGSFDQLSHSSSFPAWIAVCSAAFFGLLFLLALLRAERSLANVALAALTFSGLAIAAAVGLQSRPETGPERGVATTAVAGPPALACIDDLAGETTLAACEKVLFSAPDTVAAAVAYTGSRINRLIALSSAANANRVATPDEQALRNAIERDRYGFVAYVLTARDKCQPTNCAAFAAMTDHRQVASNMEGLIYEGLVARYAPGWGADSNPVVDLTASQPVAVSKPGTIDFPSADSIPPVSIMTEPATRAPPAQTQPSQQDASSQPATGGPYVPARGSTPKRRASPKRAPASEESNEPVRITPPPAE